jgi:hypothetical protein
LFAEPFRPAAIHVQLVQLAATMAHAVLLAAHHVVKLLLTELR